MVRQTEAILEELLERVKGLEHQAEIMKTVLIVKEPTSLPAAEAFEGLRKTVIAGAAARRSHLTQLIQVAVAVSRARRIEDLSQRVGEWLDQAGILRVTELPEAVDAGQYFEDLSGEGLVGPLEIVEPAYLDSQNGQLLRPGLARRLSQATTQADAGQASDV
jgi:hypothetical protein